MTREQKLEVWSRAYAAAVASPADIDALAVADAAVERAMRRWSEWTDIDMKDAEAFARAHGFKLP